MFPLMIRSKTWCNSCLWFFVLFAATRTIKFCVNLSAGDISVPAGLMVELHQHCVELLKLINHFLLFCFSFQSQAMSRCKTAAHWCFFISFVILLKLMKQLFKKTFDWGVTTGNCMVLSLGTIYVSLPLLCTFSQGGKWFTLWCFWCINYQSKVQTRLLI